MSYREQVTELAAGDRICLYTDGVTEAFDIDGEMFSDQGMEDAMNLHMEDAGNPDTIVDELYDDVETFARGAAQSDDITMVYLAR